MRVKIGKRIKYKGEYYSANTPFLIDDADIEDFRTIGALFIEDAQNKPLDIYLKTPKDELKSLVDLVEDSSILKKLIVDDKRKFAKDIYGKRLEEVLKAQGSDEDVN